MSTAPQPAGGSLRRARRGGLVGASAGAAGFVVLALAAALWVHAFRARDDLPARAPGHPVASAPAVAAEAAARAAAEPLARFQDPPYDPSFGGMWITRTTGRPRVCVAVVGSPSPALAAALARARRAAAVSIVPADRSWGDLDRLTLRLARDAPALRRLGIELVEWGPQIDPEQGGSKDPVPTGVVAVRLHRYTSALERLLLRRYRGEPLYVVHASTGYPRQVGAAWPLTPGAATVALSRARA